MFYLSYTGYFHCARIYFGVIHGVQAMVLLSMALQRVTEHNIVAMT